MIKQTIGPVQDLLAVRIAQYKEGVPASPTADQIGTGYLSNPSVWPNQTPAEQLRSMQLFSDLLGWRRSSRPRAAGERTGSR